jgi:hypothetical protein
MRVERVDLSDVSRHKLPPRGKGKKERVKGEEKGWGERKKDRRKKRMYGKKIEEHERRKRKEVGRKQVTKK